MTFDVARIREDFPILRRTVHGNPLVYLDNAATTQKPQSVIRTISEFYERHNANIHRGIHTLSEEATTLVDQAREAVARFLGGPKPHSVIFTRNATEAINLVAYAWGRKNITPRDEILLTEVEHHSNLIPWQILSQERGARLRFVPMSPEGAIDLETARRTITPKTKLFAFTAVSNALGTIQPVRELIQLAHENGAVALVDGSQWVPHLGTDVAAWGCDFLAFSGHKMLGPTGVGVLYAKEELLEPMAPFLGGGDMIREVWLERSTYAELPYRFEAGTPAIADIVGLEPAIRYLETVGLAAVRRHELDLTSRALEILRQEGITVYGPAEPETRSGVISFNVSDVHPHDVGQVFDSLGIAIRAGHHCCQPLMRKLQVGATARVSFYLYNTLSEVEALGPALRKVKEFFKVPVHG